MDTNTITTAIQFCQANNYFHASAVFLVIPDNRPKHCGFVVISEDSQIQENWREINASGDYTFEFYSETEVYQKLLSRDAEVVTVFSHAISIFDSIRITPRILSSIEPIAIYNQQITKLMEVSNRVHSKTEIPILFCDIDDIQQFISKTFIPLCGVIKSYLCEGQYWVDWQYGYRTINREVLLTFSVKSSDREDILQKLQLHLYENVSELQLHRVHIPFDRPQSYIDELPDVIGQKTYRILCHITEEFLAMFSQEDINDNKKTTLVTYFYLVAAKNFLSSKDEFVILNKMLLNRVLVESISPFTRHLLNHEIITGAKDKIVREYKRQSDKNKVALYTNYGDLINDWRNMPDDNDAIHESLSSLVDIRSYMDSAFRKDNNYVLSYFHAFFEKLTKCMDLPPFYIAYIPYCINYLTRQ